jgi:hypothetical protein
MEPKQEREKKRFVVRENTASWLVSSTDLVWEKNTAIWLADKLAK